MTCGSSIGPQAATPARSGSAEALVALRRRAGRASAPPAERRRRLVDGAHPATPEQPVDAIAGERPSPASDRAKADSPCPETHSRFGRCRSPHPPRSFTPVAAFRSTASSPLAGPRTTTWSSRDERVSRHHARVYRENGAVWIADLGSRHGSAAERQPISEGAAELQPGRRVTIGEQMLRLLAAQETRMASREQAGDRHAGRGLRSGRAHRSIGRDEANDVVPGRPQRLALPCRGRSDRGRQWKSVDLGSRNGTRVDGEIVDRAPLRPGSRRSGSVPTGSSSTGARSWPATTTARCGSRPAASRVTVTRQAESWRRPR